MSIAGHQVLVRDGLNWFWGGAHTDDALGFSNHEWYLKPVFQQLLPEGGVFLDVGAQVGHWSLRMASRASRVIAVEPNPFSVTVLRRNIALNGIANIKVAEVAAWDDRTVLYFPRGPAESRCGGLQLHEDGDIPVIAVPLDELPVLAIEPVISLVKLDVEGADLHALRGMQETLARCQPDLLIELHEGYAREEMNALLSDLGYQWQELPPEARLVAWPKGQTERDVRVDMCAPPDIQPYDRVRMVRSGDGAMAREWEP